MMGDIDKDGIPLGEITDLQWAEGLTDDTSSKPRTPSHQDSGEDNDEDELEQAQFTPLTAEEIERNELIRGGKIKYMLSL